MKTKEEILKDLADPIREAVLSAITPIISNAMTMYSDQQNKEKDAEIQRLTKEVEDSKVRLKQAVEFAGTKGGENTRLRELLERAGSMMSTVKHLEVLEVIDKDKYDQILSEINALNHKP